MTACFVSSFVSNVALQRSSGLDETGPVVWHMALCLLLSTILVAASLMKGIKSSGKVSQNSPQGESRAATISSTPHVFQTVFIITFIARENVRQWLIHSKQQKKQ